MPTDIVIVSAARTPIATAYKGSLGGVDAFALAELVIKEAVERSGIAPADFEDAQDSYRRVMEILGEICGEVIAPNAEIVRRLKALHPDTPVIGFPKGAGGKLPDYANEVGADAIGLDETVDPVWADKALPAHLPVQGNLDPLALIAGGTALEAETRQILAAMRGRPFVFNLGHGIEKITPPEHVTQLVRIVRSGG